jgi:CRISPR/Cas system-associated endonuclease Cas3-HD
LESYLGSTVTALEEFIQQDLPFLRKERKMRLASIRETLSHPEKTAAEKYRRVMEAFQVEAEYGRTVEVYQETIDIEGQPILVDILRLDRLSLFCQSPDGKIAAHYDRTTGH